MQFAQVFEKRVSVSMLLMGCFNQDIWPIKVKALDSTESYRMHYQKSVAMS